MPNHAAAVPQFTVRRTDRPRVLVEDADLDARRDLERRLRGEDYEVIGCCGPETLSRRRCPIEERGVCPAVAEADVVVTTLRDDTARQADVLAGIRAQHPQLPVVVRASGPVAHRLRHLLDGCEVRSLSDDTLASLDAALEAPAST